MWRDLCLLLQALTSVSADLGMLHPALPEVGLRDKAQELVQGAVKGHVTACFAALQQRVTAAVGRCRQQLLQAAQPGAPLGGQGQVLAATFGYIQAVLQKGIVAVLQVGLVQMSVLRQAAQHACLVDGGLSGASRS
jgi:hypothetical protein